MNISYIILGSSFLLFIASIYLFYKGIVNRKKTHNVHMVESLQSMGSSIDKAQRLIANADYVKSKENNALAGEWHTSKRFCDNKNHKERDGRTYAIKGSWAIKKGFIKANSNGYLEDITLPSCNCHITYLFNLQSIPEDMITSKYIKFIEKNKIKTRV